MPNQKVHSISVQHQYLWASCPQEVLPRTRSKFIHPNSPDLWVHIITRSQEFLVSFHGSGHGGGSDRGHDQWNNRPSSLPCSQVLFIYGDDTLRLWEFPSAFLFLVLLPLTQIPINCLSSHPPSSNVVESSPVFTASFAIPRYSHHSPFLLPSRLYLAFNRW